MLDNDIVTAKEGAVCVFDDDNQRLLSDELQQIGENGYSGVMNTLINSALDQGQADYPQLLQLKLMQTHLARGIENLANIITSFKPVDRVQALAMAQQQLTTLSLDSHLLANQPHPLLQQD